jgi:hypothetical protein
LRRWCRRARAHGDFRDRSILDGCAHIDVCCDRCTDGRGDRADIDTDIDASSDRRAG